jgi:hypothetical protein
MKTIRKEAFMGIMIACILMVASVQPAFAEKLNWETETVYFRHDVLIFEGYFSNNSPMAVDRINEFRARVKVRRYGAWRQLTSATFKDIEFFIRPGESKRFTFRITGVEPRHIGKWKVSIWMEYHYLNRHPNERHRHYRDWD